LGRRPPGASRAQARGRSRDLLGHGPPKRAQLPGQGDHDLRRVCAAGAAGPLASAEASLGLPTDVLDGLRQLCQAPWQGPPDCGGVARGPGPVAQRATGMGMPRLGDAALTAPRARRGLRGGEAQGMPERSGGSDTEEVAACRPGGHRPGARHAAQGLEGIAPRGLPPGLDLGVERLCEPCPPCGGLGDGADVCLAPHRWGGSGTAHRAAPPQVRGAPGGSARRAASLPQQERLVPTWGRLASAAGLCTGAAQVADGGILHPGDVDRGQVPRAQQAGQLARVTTVRCAPSARLLGEQRWSPPQQP